LAFLVLLSLPFSGGLTASVSHDDAETRDHIVVLHGGAAPSMRGAPQRFTGAVRIDALSPPRGPFDMSAGSVTFQPGARSVWHSHPFGQLLIVTAGEGRVQRWGDPVQVIRAGDVVWIPPGQKHWHGASPTTAMTHIAIQEGPDGQNVEWMEAVTNEQYGK
jgi:quercetin dioxygenase-like cupin family protein